MKVIDSAAALIAAAMVWSAGAGAQETQGVTLQDPASIERFLDGYVAAAMADQYPPAATVAVATRDKVFVKTYGVKDYETGEAATPDTLFRIASISKTFVWTSVMMLAEEGELDLNVDVNTYLKTIEIPDAYGKPVTLNDLMAHRAGFEDTLGDFFESRTGRGFEESLIRHMPKRVAPPGQRTSYSNWGTDLAAQIVAEVSGIPYDDFVRTKILKPLEMDSTTLRDPASATSAPLNDADLDARFASPHKLEEGAPTVMSQDAIEPTYAAGAMALSARDAGRWLQFFLRGGAYKTEIGSGRLLSPESFAMMRQRNFQDRATAPDFAHGFMESEIAGYRTFGHGGTLSGFISDMTVAPNLGVGVFVVVNGAETPRLPDAISRAVIEQFAGANSYAAAWSAAASPERIARAKDLDGTYLGNRRLHSKFEKIVALGSELKIAAKDDGSLVVVSGGAAKRYYPTVEDTWTDRAGDALFAYRDQSGAVFRVSSSLGTNTYEKIGFFQSTEGFLAGLGAAALLSLTTLLGAWRRQGRAVRTTGAGKLIAAGLGLAALVWLSFIGVLGWAMASLGAADLPDLVEMGWPPAALMSVHWAAYAAALAGVFVAAATAPVWTSSGWTFWRRLHHFLFALAGLFAAYEMWNWRLILAPMTTV